MFAAVAETSAHWIDLLLRQRGVCGGAQSYIVVAAPRAIASGGVVEPSLHSARPTAGSRSPFERGRRCEQTG